MTDDVLLFPPAATVSDHLSCQVMKPNESVAIQSSMALDAQSLEGDEAADDSEDDVYYDCFPVPPPIRDAVCIILH